MSALDRVLPLLLALSAACGGDADGDGILSGVDCDDGDPAVGLGATWYPDADGDGYGASGAGVEACAGAQGQVAVGGDCDDGDPATFPGASEVWYDGVDQACDGGSDFDQDGDGFEATRYGGDDCDDVDPETHPDAVDAPYDGLDTDCDGGSDFDLDGDGWDSEALAGGGDCDDLDPAVHPDAAEVWYDGADQDCDGGSDFDQDGDGWDSEALASGGDCDDLDPGVSPGAPEAYYDGVDQDCDGASDWDLDGDGWDSEALAGGGDCDDEDPEAHPGAFEWHDGDDDDCDGLDDVRSLESAESIWVGETAADAAATAVAGAEDLDGDGRPDLLIGAAGWRGGAGRGAVYVVSGAGLGAETSPASLWGAVARLGATEDGALLGTAVAGVGDLDGDGWGEALAGAPGAAGTGAAWVWRGPLTGESLTADAVFGILGGENGGQLGQAVAGGADLDSDGLPDLVVGIPGADADRGALALLAADLTGEVGLDRASAILMGGTPGERAGATAALVGDVDGDGLADLLVGAPGRGGAGTGAGAAYLTRAPLSGSASLGDADAVLLGQAEGDEAGGALGGAGDVDGDGLADVLVGAPGADVRASGGGAAYLFLGPVGTGALDLGGAAAVFGGDLDGILAGSAVAGVGDLDADGFDDVLIGAPGIALGGAPLGGGYLVLGPISGSLCTCGSDAKFYGSVAGDQAGASLAGPGDLDGDGFADLAFGAPAAGLGGSAAGAAWLVRGAAR